MGESANMVTGPSKSPSLQSRTLGFTWGAIYPFLFGIHRDDTYPKANAQSVLTVSLTEHSIGQDFQPRRSLQHVPQQQRARISGAPAPGF